MGMTRKPWSRALFAAAALAVSALVPSALPSEAHTPSTCTVSSTDLAIDAEEQKLLDLINQYRQANGLNRLFFQHDVVRAASWLSRDMATNNYFRHIDSNGRTMAARLTWCGASYSNAAENIAAVYTTAQAVFDAWRASSGHNANMLRSGVGAAGIGRAHNASSTYGWYWTLDVTNTSVLNLAVGDVRVTEGNGGYGMASFPVTLSNPSSGTVSVAFTTSDSTATQPGDYTARSGTLSFAPGVVRNVVHVPIRGDTADEVAETFRVNLSSPAGAVISDGVGVGTIVDDDPSSGLRLTIGNVAVNEGDSTARTVHLNFRLSAPAASAVSVNYATADHTATQPADYRARTGTVTFDPGVTSRVVEVTLVPDIAAEANESFLVRLSGATGGATIATGTGVVTIRNDD